MKKIREPLLRIDRDRIEVFVHGDKKKITYLEYRLLTTLLDSKKALTRDQLLKKCWNHDRGIDIETRTVDQHVKRLRDKLGFQAVETITGFGYRIAAGL